MVSLTEESTTAVLTHVHRYGLTLPGILDGAGVLGECDEGRCLEALIELAQQGLLGMSDLYPGYRNEPYFHLSERGATKLNVSPKAAGPLPPKARKKCYAVAAFCTLSKIKREKLTGNEFRTQFSDLWYRGQPTDYYVETLEDGRQVLGYFKPDLGGSGGWDNLLKSCYQFYQRRMDLNRVRSGEFHPFVRNWQQRAAEGLFRIAVLTSQQDKVVRLWEAVRMQELAGKAVAPIRVYLVPGLFDVLFPRPAE